MPQPGPRARRAAGRWEGSTQRSVGRVQSSWEGQLAAMAEDFTRLEGAEVERRIEEVRARMRPVQLELDRLRAERDVLATELRRRERLASMNARRDLQQRMR